MPDFGAPVAVNVNVNPNQGIQTLSGILGLQQQRQALQTGRSLQETAKAEAVTKGIEAQARTEASSFLQNFDIAKYHGEDGTLDTNAALTDKGYQKLSGPAKDLANNYIFGVKAKQIENKANMAKLNTDVVAAGARLMGALTGDADVKAGNEKGKEKLHVQAEMIRRLFPDQGAALIDPYMKGIESGHVKPEDWARATQAFALQASDVAAPRTGTQVGPNGATTGFTQNQISGEVDQSQGSAPLGLSPQQLASPITMPNGQVVTLGQFLASQGGGRGAMQPPGGSPAGPPGAAPAGPRTAAQDAPPPNAPKAVQDAYQAAVSKTNQHVDTIRTADESYGLNMRIADQIRTLSQETTSGPGSTKLNHIMGVLGLPFGSNKQANYQLMGAYLDRQAATMRTAMGLPSTNEGIQTSQSIVGNTEYQAKALQDKNDLTQALSEGFHQYRNGLDRIAGFGGQASPRAVDQFKNAWTNAFDPNVFRGELAYKRSKKEGDAFVASLDPAEAASLKKKRAVLNALSRGQIPQ